MYFYIIYNVYLCLMILIARHRQTHSMVRIIFLTILFSWAAADASAQKVTVSNNLLYDAWLTPNLRVGYRLSPQWSVGLTAGYRPWPTSDETTRKYRHLLLSPEVRYWTDSVNVHHFFGVNLIYSHYNVGGITFPFGLYKSVREERKQGDLGALGLFYGYSWPLGRYWNIEAVIGAAVGYTRYERFQCGHCGKKLSLEKKIFAMPQAALNIVYNIPGRAAKMIPVEEPVVVTPPAPEPEPFVPVVREVPDFTGRAGQLQKDNPVLAPMSEYRPYDKTRILRKEKGALFVHFALGKSVLDSTFRENSVVMDRIVDITRQIMADSTSSVKKIQIIGLASIEGKPELNEKLALNRALALQHYIQDKVEVPDEMFETVGGGEAWTEFRDHLNDLVAEGSQKDIQLDKAIEIIDSESDAMVRERRIRQLDKGRTWKFVKEHILSDQRNSGYIRIYYDYVPDTNAKVINEASELLTTDCSDCHHEALRLLLSVKNDERAQNALGTAYWLCGQQQEALDCFRRAAANGNADAQENLKQLQRNR